MRKLLSVFLLLIATVAVHAQSSMQWQQIYGGNGVEVGYSVKTCMSQGYIVAGSSASNGPTDGHIIRTDTLGLVMWEKFYGGPNIDVIRSIKLLPDSGFICAGYSNSSGMGGYDGWVLRLDKNGDTLWTKYFGTTDWDFFYDVEVTYDSAFVLAGGTYGAGAGDEDMWFVKIDSLGDLEWMRTWGGVKMDEARGVCQTEDSLLVACGVTYSLGDSLGDAWILRMDATDGDTIWTRKSAHATGADIALGVASDNGQQRFGIVGQYTTATGDLNAFVWILRLDSTTQMDLTAGISGYEYYSSIVFMKTSYNFATLGSTENDGAGNGEVFFFHTVDYIATTYGTQQYEAGYGIDTAHSKGYIACGYSEGYGNFGGQTYLVKIDSTGASTIVIAIHETPHAADPICSIYPNPSSSTATIQIDVLSPVDDLNLVLVDALGNVVTAVSENQITSYSPTSSACTINTSDLSDGLYFVQVYSNKELIQTAKLTVVH